MRKLLSLILALTLVFSLAACAGDNGKPDEDEEDEDVEVSVEEDSDEGEVYDGPTITVLQCEFVIEHETEGWRENGRIVYDENGNVKTRIICDEHGEETQRTVYAYDADGNEILAETYRDGMLTESVVTEYDGQSRIVSVIRSVPGENMEQHQTITYHEDGIITNCSEVYAGGMLVYKSMITMDEYYNHLSITEEIDGESTYLEGPYTYEYIQDGNQLIVNRYQDGECWFSYEETRDDAGRLLSVTHYGGSRCLDIETYAYDENGNLIQKTVEYYWESGTMDTYESYITVHTYDEEDRLIKSETTNYDGFVGIVEEYTYSYVEVPAE